MNWCRVTKTDKGSVLPGAEFPRPKLDSYSFDRSFLGEETSRDRRVESNYVDFDPALAPGKYTMRIEGRYSAKDDPTLPQDPPEFVLTMRPARSLSSPTD